MKTLHLKQNLPFAGNPPFVELDDEKILANNVILPGETNYHGTRLWVIGHVYGAIAAVWADCEQDALDELCDVGMADCFLIDEEEQSGATDSEREEWAYLGNASEPADLSDAWMAPVEFDPARDLSLIIALAEARGACQATLYS